MDDIAHGVGANRTMDHVTLELLHVPRPVHLEVRPEFKKAVGRHEERASLDRQQDERFLDGVQVLREQGESIRIPLRVPGEADERGGLERIRVTHSSSDRHPRDEGCRRRTGSLKRPASLDFPADVLTKLEEAKSALERGEFEQARRFAAEARAERPDDPEIRELFAVTHLARAIRLSDAAREGRRLDLIRREIDYDVEFHDSPAIETSFNEALAAIDEVLRVEPGHWKARMLKAALLFRRDRTAGRPAALEILRALAAAEPANKQVPFTIRKVERPCMRCEDTGFCPYCKGRGERTFLRMHRKCDRCYGRGICPACGIL